MKMRQEHVFCIQPICTVHARSGTRLDGRTGLHLHNDWGSSDSPRALQMPVLKPADPLLGSASTESLVNALLLVAAHAPPELIRRLPGRRYPVIRLLGTPVQQPIPPTSVWGRCALLLLLWPSDASRGAHGPCQQ